MKERQAEQAEMLGTLPKYFLCVIAFLISGIVLVLVLGVFLVGREIFLEGERLAREMEGPCLEFLEGPDADYRAFENCQKQEKKNREEIKRERQMNLM